MDHDEIAKQWGLTERHRVEVAMLDDAEQVRSRYAVLRGVASTAP